MGNSIVGRGNNKCNALRLGICSKKASMPGSKVSKAGRRLAINEFIEVSQGSYCIVLCRPCLLEGLNEKRDSLWHTASSQMIVSMEEMWREFLQGIKWL